MSAIKAVGLVAEYNPFHNGHRYHLQKAKEVTGADVVVAVMSGDFSQRGEPTILDKWTRAKTALQSGVDLVVELPIFYAVQPAHIFAAGALRLLNALQVSDVVYGAEHPDWDFTKLVQAEQEFSSTEFHRYNATYATQFNMELQQLTGHQLTDPNDILAFSYEKARQQQGLLLHLHPIQRVGSDYHDPHVDGSLSSATAIRKAVASGESIDQTVPVPTAEALKQLKHVPSWDDLYPLLRNHLIQAPVAELGQYYEVAEGLEYRMKEAASRNLSFDGFNRAVKSKRYTYARLLRAYLYTLLEMTKDQVKDQLKHPYIHVLGFTGRGQQYLHDIKKSVPFPLVTNVNQRVRDNVLQLDYRAGKLYQMFNGVEQDLKHAPVRIAVKE